MTPEKRKYSLLPWVIAWIMVSLLSWYLVDLKSRALDFHTRDYAFYTEFMIKWSKPAAEQRYSINPGGYNFMGVSEVDGCRDFYQWVHMEPIRFVQAGIYAVSHSLKAVFMFNALLVCSPILILGLWLGKIKTSIIERLGWLALLVFFPAFLLTAGYDNRPSMFLGSIFAWQLYFLLATEKKVMQVVCFVLLCCIREEALILNAFVLLYLLIRLVRKKYPLSFFLTSLGIYIMHAALVLFYFQSWKYKMGVYSPVVYPTLGMVCLAVVAGCILVWSVLKKQEFLLLFIPLLIFIFQFSVMHGSHIFPDEGYNLLNDPRNLGWGLLLILLLMYFRVEKNKPTYMYMTGLLPVLLIFQFLGTNNLFGRTRYLNSRIEQTNIIQSNVQYMREHQTNDGAKGMFGIDPNYYILTDYSTHQFFLGHPKLICMDRLPCYIDRTSTRFYPANAHLLSEFCEDGTWIFVSKNNNAFLEASSGLENIVVDENTEFKIIWLTDYLRPLPYED